jgi:branched-chain amino acid transport system substrate-binding protein
MKKAIEQKPFVIMGTVYSSSTIVNMGILQKAGIPQIVGSEATVVTQKGNPNIFRTSYSTLLAMKKLARYIVEGFNAEKLAVVYANDTFGKSGRDAVVDLTTGKAELVADIATEVGQTDFTGEIARLKRSGADTLYFQVHEEEGARLMMQLKEAGLKLNCSTYGTDITHIADLAKSDADGLVGIDLPAEAPPIMPLNKKYMAKYGEPCDAEAVKGYVGTYVVKATAEKVGSFDQQKFRDTLHNSTIYVKDEPGVLMDISYDANGDIDRDSFLVEIKNGKITIKETLPPLSK